MFRFIGLHDSAPAHNILWTELWFQSLSIAICARYFNKLLLEYGFNNREKAIAIWFIIAMVIAFTRKQVRSAFWRFLRALFNHKVLVILSTMLLYEIMIVYSLESIYLWRLNLMKDTLFWLLGTAFMLQMSLPDISKDASYLRKIVIDNMKFTCVFEFIFNFYAFRLWAEIIMVPLIFWVAFFSSFAGARKEHQPVREIMDGILSIWGTVIIFFTIYKIFINWQQIANLNILREFLLPLLLTLAYMPFLYLWALYMAYESLFNRINMILREKDKKVVAFAKQKIFSLCFLNLPKINAFSKVNYVILANLNDQKDVVKMILAFKKSEKYFGHRGDRGVRS